MQPRAKTFGVAKIALFHVRCCHAEKQAGQKRDDEKERHEKFERQQAGQNFRAEAAAQEFRG